MVIKGTRNNRLFYYPFITLLLPFNALIQLFRHCDDQTGDGDEDGSNGNGKR